MSESTIREKIIGTILAMVPALAGARFEDPTTFADLGLDSLKVIELGVLLEDAFGKRVQLDRWLEEERAGERAYTLGSLVTFIARCTGNA